MSQLTLQNVSKTYPRAESPALIQVNLDVPAGDLLALVGESGSGKTTLLRLIAGLEIPDGGSISVADQLVSRGGLHLPPERRGVGLVFQHHALFPHLKVAQNITFGLGGMQAGRRMERLAELLAVVGLPAYGNRYPHELSGGERQRIALARALAPNPKLLLLDEPFSNLDPQWRVAIRDDTRQILKQQGTTSLLVTHHTQDALAVADQIAVLHCGKLQQSGTPRQIYHAPANAYVASLFGTCNFLPLMRLERGGEHFVRDNIAPADQSHHALWIRPEDLEIGPPQTNSPRLISGKITHVSFQGDHEDVTVLCECEGMLALEVRVQHQRSGSARINDPCTIFARRREA